ncbi:MAG TPA: DedA family protein [bacterium]|nr:DedA family protein [bacterium]
MIHSITSFFTTIFSQLNYFNITALMAIESSFIPFPSEIVIPPAAYLAAQGKLNLYLVILCGTLGSLIGALFNYFLALTLGRAIIYKLANTKIAKLLLINEHKIQKAEDYFLKYDKLATFIGRLVFEIRQLISIPAGLSKMNIGNFIIFTTLGSLIWNIILALLGYFLGANSGIFKTYYREISYGSIIIFIIIIFFILYKKKKRKKSIFEKF